MMKIWHATDSHDMPEVTECEQFGHPHRDALHRTMYENSHFLTEQAAWDFLLRSGQAGQNIGRLEYENAKARLARAEATLAVEAARRCRIDDAYAQYLIRTQRETAP